MKKNRNSLVSLLAILAFLSGTPSSNALAEEGVLLDVQTAVTATLRSNPKAASAAANRDQLYNAALGVRSLYGPSVDLNVVGGYVANNRDATRSSARSVDRFARLEVGPELRMTFFDFGTRFNTLRSAELRAQSADMTVEETVDSLILQTVQGFIDLGLRYEAYVGMRLLISEIDRFRERVRKAYALDQVKKSVLAETDQRVNRIRRTLGERLLDLRETEASLAHLTGLTPPATGWTLELFQPVDPGTVNQNNLCEEMKGASVARLRALRNVEAAKASSEAFGADRFGRITGSVSSGFGSGVSGAEGQRSAISGIIRYTIPLYDAGKSSSDQAASYSLYKAALYDLADVEGGVLEQCRRLSSQLKLTGDLKAAANAELTAALANLDVWKLERALDDRTLIEYLDLMERVVEARLSYFSKTAQRDATLMTLLRELGSLRFYLGVEDESSIYAGKRVRGRNPVDLLVESTGASGMKVQ